MNDRLSVARSRRTIEASSRPTSSRTGTRTLRSDDEVVNAILMNRHWTPLRLEITGRRMTANGTLRETLTRHLSAGEPTTP